MEQKKSNQMVFGIRAVIEAIDAGKEIENLFIQRGLTGGLFKELQTVINKNQVKYQLVPVEKLNRLTTKNHQGVVGFISPIIYQKVEDIIPTIYEKGETPLVLILDRVTDVRNFGAIVRTAECSGVHAVVIPLKGAAQINEDAVKTSAGGLYTVPICREFNLKHTIQFLKDSGLQVVACTEKDEQTVYDVNFKNPTAIIMGSEEDGISKEYLKLSDEFAKIPLLGEIESLNVSVSAGVILYEAVRQRLS
jgi:23S rRNA (guanosine2251-2'-O)-methyltransferase